MYQKKGQLKKGAMWETQCHINLASIPPIKILMGMILGMVCGIEFTGFTTIGDFQKPWKILEGQGLVYFWVGSSSRTCRGTSRLDLFGTLKMTDLMKHDTILMKKSKTHLYIYNYIYIQCNGCKLMAATVVWRYRPRCLEHNFPKSTEKGNHGSFIRKLMADGNL